MASIPSRCRYPSVCHLTLFKFARIQKFTVTFSNHPKTISTHDGCFPNTGHQKTGSIACRCKLFFLFLSIYLETYCKALLSLPSNSLCNIVHVFLCCHLSIDNNLKSYTASLLWLRTVFPIYVHIFLLNLFSLQQQSNQILLCQMAHIFSHINILQAFLQRTFFHFTAN